MNKASVFLCIFVLTFVFLPSANADLTMIGTFRLFGTDEYRNLLYENDQDLIWYDYTTVSNTWEDQVDWIDVVNISWSGEHYDSEGNPIVRYSLNSGISVTWNDDWRLPIIDEEIYSIPEGYNQSQATNELGHLYYETLGLTGGGDPTGSTDQWGDLYPFENLYHAPYWTGTHSWLSESEHWNFLFNGGYQTFSDDNTTIAAIAVRSGHVDFAPVPVPTTMLLLGTGLFGLALAGRKKFFKK